MSVSPIPFAHHYLVQATDNAVPPLSVSREAEIRIININDPPVAADITVAVPEDATAGTTIGLPMHATDEDVGSQLTMAITSGDDNNLFALSATGQLSLRKPLLDFEAKATYTLSITVPAPPTHTHAAPPLLNPSPFIRLRTMA